MNPKLPVEVARYYQKAHDNYESFWGKAAISASRDIYWFK